MKDFFLGRQAIYEFLTLAFYRVPNEKIIDYAKKFNPVFKALSKDCSLPELKKGVELLEMADISDLLQLNASYTKLFVMGKKSVELSESGWRDESDQTEIVLAVTSFFADDDIARPAGVNLKIDSYASELYYLFMMSEKLLNADIETQEILIKRQIQFLNEHLLSWESDFRNAVHDKCDNNFDIFYGALTELASGYMKFDTNALNEILNENIIINN